VGGAVADCGAILIVDADSESRASIARFFRSAGYPVVEVERGEEALAAARTEQPALVLLDVGLPDISGFEVCQELRDMFGDDVPIMFVAGGRPTPVDRAAGFLVGGDDYLVKPVNRDELLARARRSISRSRSARLLPTQETGPLTKREHQVLTLLADGRRSNEIAHELTISPKTVASHVQRIIGKLGAHTRTEAIAIAYQEGLIASGTMRPDPDFEAHGGGRLSVARAT
jgi:DNA-binding NarL/FixJ family response regulator